MLKFQFPLPEGMINLRSATLVLCLLLVPFGPLFAGGTIRIEVDPNQLPAEPGQMAKVHINVDVTIESVVDTGDPPEPQQIELTVTKGTLTPPGSAP